MLFVTLMLVTLAGSPGGGPVPGTKLRLGMTEKQTQGAGEFAEGRAADAAGMATRSGALRFFGVPCKATLYFKDGRLARARFEADAVSPHAVDYVEDQLRRQRMWRECSRYEPSHKVCDWIGETKLHLEVNEGHLEARAEPPGQPPEETVAETARPAAPKPAATAAPPSPAPAGGTPAPTSASSTTGGTSTPPATGPASATTAATTPPPAPAAPATTAGAVASPTAVATLPETLTISLVTKNSPSDWPRIVSSPPLEYPAAARRESVQGVVWVLALVGADGAVQGAQIDRGIRELNDAAVSWIQHSKFAPCNREGSPCRFWVRVAVRYTLY